MARRERGPALEQSSGTGEVRAVVKALELLEHLSGKGRASLTELAGAIGLPPSTAYRLLATLKERRFVLQDDTTRSYTLGPTLISMLAPAVTQFDIRRVARPTMERVAELTRESAHLVVAIDLDLISIDVIEGPQDVVAKRPIGTRLPVHATAVGRVFLAYSPRFQAALAAGRIPLEPLTPRTVTTRDELLREVEATVARGYAVNLGERSEQTASVAVPLRKPDGTLAGALGISAPLARLNTQEELDRLGQVLLDATRTGPYAEAWDGLAGGRTPVR